MVVGFSFSNNCFETLTSKKHQQNKCPSIEFSWVYSNIHLPFCPPDIHCLNYQPVMNICFTLDRLFRINNTTNDTSLQWGTNSESLEHLFVKCGEVQGLRAVQS